MMVEEYKMLRTVKYLKMVTADEKELITLVIFPPFSTRRIQTRKNSGLEKVDAIELDRSSCWLDPIADRCKN